MHSHLFFTIILFASLLVKASSQQETYFLLEQGERVASSQEAADFKKKCDDKKDSVSCYDYAVHLAQTLDDESQAVPYYKLACDMKYEVGCFNLGGILIKNIDTRANGIDAFKKSCLASKDVKVSKQKKEILKVSCDLIPILEKHLSSPYPELYQFLKAANPPPSQGRKNKIKQKPDPGSEAFKEMNASIDKRLMSLKNKDPKVFKTEMELQKLFNNSVKNFCSHYEKKCEGSVCNMCIESCYSTFYTYRKQQAEEINTSSLLINSEMVSEAITEKYFRLFADGLCQIPESVWNKSKRPKQCSDVILSEIQSKVVSTMTESDENEGDVCAQLSN